MMILSSIDVFKVLKIDAPRGNFFKSSFETTTVTIHFVENKKPRSYQIINMQIISKHPRQPSLNIELGSFFFEGLFLSYLLSDIIGGPTYDII
jgi:hypothetical protein